jgi:hypothetical protein
MLHQPRHNFILVLSLLLALCANAGAQQVVLQLKNGDRLTGKISSETTNQVVLTTTWSNNITIPLAWITNRVPVAVVAATNPPVAPAPAVLIVAPAPKPTPPPAPVVLMAKKPQLWHYEAQVGLNLQYNQITSQLYYGALKAMYTGDLWRDIMTLNANYGKVQNGPTDTISANNMFTSWRVEHDINKTKRAFVFNAVDAGYDQVRQIHFTYDESAGAGYKFIERPNFIVTGDSGLNYQKQYFYQHVEQDNFSLRLAEMITWKINPRLSWDEKVEFYPRFTSWSDYRFRAESNLAYKLNAAGNLFLTLGLVDVFDTQPPANVSKNDLQVRSTLALKF